jgi:hypothetical protein
VQLKGDYRQIVYHVERDLRTWIKFTDHADAGLDMAAFNFYSNIKNLSLLYLEMYFTNGSALSRETWRRDIFYLTPDETRKIYQTPDENAAFEIITPASKTFQGDWKRGGSYHAMLRFTQIRNGFAEVLVDRYPQAESSPLGWIKLKEEGYESFWHYGGTPSTCGRSDDLTIQLFSAENERRKVYTLPDYKAEFREFDREAFQENFTGYVNVDNAIEVFILDLHDGFVLIGGVDGYYDAVSEDDICMDEGCGSPCEFAVPIGWIPIRDEQHRLMIWPSIPAGWNCTC